MTAALLAPRIFCTLPRKMIEFDDSWVHRERSAKRAFFLAKCGLPILFACHQVWSGVDNNSELRWQTNIGGIRQIKLAGWIEEDSTTNTNPSSCLWIPNPVRQAVQQTGCLSIVGLARRRGQSRASNAAASESYPLDPWKSESPSPLLELKIWNLPLESELYLFDP